MYCGTVEIRVSYCRTIASYYGHGLSSDYLQISFLLTEEAYARLKQGQFFFLFFFCLKKGRNGKKYALQFSCEISLFFREICFLDGLPPAEYTIYLC